jgi:DNA-binding transcriptional LysR family regulator
MDLIKSMQVFVTVVDTGSLTAAATRLGTSTAMVSSHVQHLEARLGTPLVLRTTRRHTITEFGRYYYDNSLKIIRLIEDLDNAALELVEHPKGFLKLTVPRSFAVEVFMARMKEFYDAYPGITMEIKVTDSVMDMMKEGFDAAIRIGELPDSDLIARPLEPYSLIICASPGYLKGRERPVKLQDLSNHECLALDYSWSSDWRPYQREWRLHGPEGEEAIAIPARIKLNDALALRSCVMQNMGIAMLPKLVIRKDLQAGRLIQLLENYQLPSRPMHLLYNANPRMPSRLRVFVNFILDTFGRR